MKRTPRKPVEPRAEATSEVPASRDELIAKAIEDAMRPYLAVLPPYALKSMRDALEEALTTHPVAVEALDEMMEQAAKDGSGTRARGDAPHDPHDDDEDGGVA
jgi:hypothetical protein